MTPAEKRIKELIDRWLTSIELHLQYVELSDEAYREIQAWPKHDRPTRWVLELAKQKATDLKEAFDARHRMGDSKFADSLELMSFLANLVGAQHVDRFVPLAEPQPDTTIPKPTPKVVASAPTSSDMPKWYAQAHASAPSSPPSVKTAATRAEPAKPLPSPPPTTLHDSPQTRPLLGVTPVRAVQKAADPDATREMPKFRAQLGQAAAPVPVRSEPKKPAAPAKQSAKPASAPAGDIQSTVITDAVRLLSWGKTWHELAELIARMADRPSLAEVRKLLRAHRATIEKTFKETSK